MPLMPVTQVEGSGGGGGLFDAYALLWNQETSGTGGGATSAASFVKMTLDQLVDPAGFVGLSNSQITLGTGTYLVRAHGQAWSSDAGGPRCKLRLRDITNTATAIVGGSGFGTQGAAEASLFLVGRMVVTGTTVFEMQLFVNAGNPSLGQGVDGSSGEVEVYNQTEIYREAS